MCTIGLSPKAYVPFITIWGAILVSWIATGEFNRAEIAGAVASCIQLLTALLANPGEVRPETPVATMESGRGRRT
jgi:hypothetical protein